MRILSMWILTGLLAGCPKPAPAPVAAAEDPAPALGTSGANQADDGRAPFPYTAGEIAASWRKGLVVRWKVTAGAADPMYSRWEVTAHDAEGVMLAYVDTDASGAVIGVSSTDQSSFEELRDHASFPAANTTVQTVDYDAPWGATRAMLYTVAGSPEEEPETVKRFWFGVDTPGAPLRHTIEVAGEPVMELRMLSREYTQ